MAQRSSVELAILGAGAAGMLGALCAARSGLRVALFDPNYSRPNNLAISGGLFPVAGSRLQAQAGVADDPERWLADLRAFAPGSVNERIAAAVAARLPQVLDFLVDRCAAPLAFLADVPAPGHSARRFHGTLPASGHALHAWLRKAVANEASVDCFPDLVVDRIERDGEGFELRCAGTGSHPVRAGCLLLAGGGFGANAQMVGRFVPAMKGALHSGSPTNDGSVIALAAEWGAALAGMDGYQGQGHSNPDGRTRLGMSLPALGALLVNRDGSRFVREDIGPSALAARVLAQPGQVALEVFDAHIERLMTNHSAYGEARAAGRVIDADTVDGLAEATGVPARELARTLADAARCARGEAADRLGRRSFARVLEAPFRASWVTGTLAHTQGGVVTDHQGRVLDRSGVVVAGLFAAGGCAAGLSGHGGDGYLPGNGLAQAFGLAYAAVAAIAGR